MSSKYSFAVMKDILSDVGEFTPLRKEFKLKEEYKYELEVIGTGKERFDFQGDTYREIIPEIPITYLGFSYGASWLDEDELLISFLTQNLDEEQFTLKNVSSMSPVKLAKKIAKEILKKTSKVKFEYDYSMLDDEDVPHFFTDEGPKRRYAYDWSDAAPPEEYFDAYNSFFKKLNATLLAPEEREVKGSLSWDLYQELVGYEQSPQERLKGMVYAVNSFQRKLTKEVNLFNKVAEKIKSKQPKMASSNILKAISTGAVRMGFKIEEMDEDTIEIALYGLGGYPRINVLIEDSQTYQPELYTEIQYDEKVIDGKEINKVKGILRPDKAKGVIAGPVNDTKAMMSVLKQLVDIQNYGSKMATEKTAGAIDMSHNGELAILLLDYFCDEFGFNGIQMSKFITKAYKQIKEEIKYAQMKNMISQNTGGKSRMRVLFNGYYPTRKGIEKCLRNMSRENFGILVMDTGRKPTLAGTDC